MDGYHSIEIAIAIIKLKIILQYFLVHCKYQFSNKKQGEKYAGDPCCLINLVFFFLFLLGELGEGLEDVK